MKEIKIFDNHKIPRKLRGKRLILRTNPYISNASYIDNHKNPHKTGFDYASSVKSSKSGRHILVIEDYDKYLYLYPSEYSLKILKQSEAVKK